MSEFVNVEEARAFFKDDSFAMNAGVRLEELWDGGAMCSMEIQDMHKNAMGRVMGGAIFTLADFALAAASNNDHMYSVSLNASINYLSPAKGTRLFAKAAVIKRGRTTSLYSVDISDDLGTKVAFLTGSCYLVDR